MFRGRERGLDPAITHGRSCTTAATGLTFKLQALQCVVDQIQVTPLAKLCTSKLPALDLLRTSSLGSALPVLPTTRDRELLSRERRHRAGIQSA